VTCVNESWIVLFGGADRESVIHRLLREGIRLAAVLVPEQRSWRLQRSIDALSDCEMSVASVTRQSLADVIPRFVADNLLCLGFPYLVPQSVYSPFRVAINVHPTLLPKYRGPTSGAYILLNDEAYSGATVHYLVEEADKGEIIAQSRVSISPFDTLRSLQRKVYETEPDLVINALRLIDAGAAPIPQNEAEASSYPRRRKPEDSLLDSSLPLRDLINAIRASDESAFPAHFYHHGEKVCLKLWRPDKPDGEEDLI
jgi:methionyl-tRNA formyltransferase